MKRIKHGLCAGLAVLLLAGMTACSKGETGPVSPASGTRGTAGGGSAPAADSTTAAGPDSTGGSLLKPLTTANGTGKGQTTTTRKNQVTETVAQSYTLSTPQEKRFASLKGTTITIIGDPSMETKPGEAGESTSANTPLFLKMFKAKYGVDIHYIKSNGSAQIGQMVAAGSPPDVYGCTEVSFLKYVYSNVAQALDGYIDKSDPYWKDMSLESHSVGGKIYALKNTYGILGYMCAFNKTLFREQKQKNPAELYLEGNWNYKTFLETAKKMTLYREDGKTVKTYGVGTWNYALFMYANGGKGLIEDGRGGLKSTIDQPAEMEGLQLLYDLVSAGALYGGDSYSGFGRRMVAMHLEAPWNAIGAYDYYNNMEDDIGIAPLPVGSGGTYYFPEQGDARFVPRNAKNPLGGMAYIYEAARFDYDRFFNSKTDVDVSNRRMIISDEDLNVYRDYSQKMKPIASYLESLTGWWDGGYRAKFWNTIVVDKKKPAEAVASMKGVLEACIKRTTG